MAGLCDYCEKDPSLPPCAHPGRHVKPNRPRARPGFLRLLGWLRDHPDVLTDLAEALRMPLPKCEGSSGPCERVVLWPTSSQTAYEWNGEGENPNKDLMLCPLCSIDYTQMMTAQWDEYNAGRI